MILHFLSLSCLPSGAPKETAGYRVITMDRIDANFAHQLATHAYPEAKWQLVDDNDEDNDHQVFDDAIR